MLIHPFNNRKGAGLLALFNEGAGQKGLALIPFDAGTTDSLVLGTVDAVSGKLTPLMTVRLCRIVGSICRSGDAGLAHDAWYRLSMNVGVSGDALTVTATVYRHTVPTDPNSALDGEVFQVPGSIGYAGSLAALGLQGAGQIGIAGSATSAVLDSSVTNFGPAGCPIFPVALMAGFPGVFSPDPATLLIALPINNVGLTDAQSVSLATIGLAGGVLASPALPYAAGIIPAAGSYVLNATFTGGPFVGGASHQLDITGTYVVGASTYCFTLRSNVVVPPGAPGFDTLDSFTVDPLVTAGPYPHVDRPPNPNVNLPRWTVPMGPFMAGDPTDTETSVSPALTAALASFRTASTSGADGRLPISELAPGDPTEFDLNTSLGLTTGTTNGTTSTTAEPSGAADGDGVVFVTANWIAAYSDDFGATWTELDPTTIFPADAVGFCCDQVVQYIPSIDRFIWWLQGTGFGSPWPARSRSSTAAGRRGPTGT